MRRNTRYTFTAFTTGTPWTGSISLSWLSSGDVRSAMQELGVQTASTARSEAGGADDDGFSVPKYNQKKQARKLQALLTSSKPMTEEEAQRVSNLWSQQLAVENRIRLYLFWLRKYQVKCVCRKLQLAHGM